MTFARADRRRFCTLSQARPHFTTLPAEVRSLIYKWLFPRLHCHNFIYLDPPKEDEEDQRSVGLKPYYPAFQTPKPPQQMVDARNLMLVNRNIRGEVVPVIFSKVTFSCWSVPQSIALFGDFTPAVKSTLRYAQMPISVYNLQEKRQLSRALKELTALEVLTFCLCDRSADEASQGTTWNIDNFHALQVIQKVLPNF